MLGGFWWNFVVFVGEGPFVGFLEPWDRSPGLILVDLRRIFKAGAVGQAPPGPSSGRETGQKQRVTKMCCLSLPAHGVQARTSGSLGGQRLARRSNGGQLHRRPLWAPPGALYGQKKDPPKQTTKLHQKKTQTLYKTSNQKSPQNHVLLAPSRGQLYSRPL